METEALRYALQRPERTVASDEACTLAAAELETTARFVALNLHDREDILAAIAEQDVDSFWSSLGALWTALATSFDPTADELATRSLASEDSRIALALGAAKFERNLVAGLYENQKEALTHESQVRRLIFNITTFTRIEDGKFFTLQAVTTQLLSNMVSPTSDPESQELADQQLELYLSGNRDDDVVIRLLDSRDIKTNVATIHLINNLTADESHLNILLTPPGVKWLAQLLGRMDDWFESQSDDRFALATGIIGRIIRAKLQAKLWDALTVKDEVVTENQNVLLKLVDSALHNTNGHDNSLPPQFAFVLATWRSVAAYATASMKSGKDDARLPKGLAALILTTEGLSSIGLASRYRSDSASQHGRPQIHGGDEQIVQEMKSPEDGIIPLLIETLRTANDFLPRIKPRRPEDAPQANDAALPFSNIKRDLVRLLGVLAYNDTKIGDQVREVGGVELVLSLCETDERNPYLREHALFCVRNLMLNNPANQQIMREMEPIGVVDENGELKPLPDKLKKSHAAAKSTVNMGNVDSQAEGQKGDGVTEEAMEDATEDSKDASTEESKITQVD